MICYVRGHGARIGVLMGAYCSCTLGDGAAVGAVVSTLGYGPLVSYSVGSLGVGSLVGDLLGNGSVMSFALRFMGFSPDFI